MLTTRSHTDPVTNVVVLSTFDIGQHFNEIRQRDFPITTLPTFLHEAAHHWCFDTPVGLTLHLLFMRARRAALVDQPSEDARWSALDAVLRYETMRDVTRPLSEGIALFAEHDAIPGTAKTLSTPLQIAAGLYGRGYAISDKTEPYKNLPVVLAAGRVSRSHARRKAALLLEPMTCAGGGYLPGYLLVKAIWDVARTVSSLFADSDFFLQYLRSHLFDDWGLVARLLDDEKRDISALSPIANHVSQRIEEFVTIALTDGRPERFETAVYAGDYESVEIRTDVVALNLKYFAPDKTTDVVLGLERFRSAFESHFAPRELDTFDAGLLEYDCREIGQRALITLGNAPVSAQYTSEGLTLSNESGPMIGIRTARLRKTVEKFDKLLDLELLALPEIGGLCLALSLDDELIATVPIGSKDLDAALQDTYITRTSRLRFAAASQSAIEQILESGSVAITRESTRESLRELIDDWLIPRALLHVEDQRLPDVRARMANDGLLLVLEGDAKLVLDAATASLCIPSPYTFGSVASFHQWSCDTPQHSIAKINRLIGQELGFQPFRAGSNGFFERAAFI